MKNPVVMPPDYLVCSFQYVSEQDVPCPHNDNGVQAGFGEWHVERIRQVLQPYFDRGLLRDFGYDDTDPKTLKVSYVACDTMAFRLTHETAPSQKIKYELRLNSHSPYELLHGDFNRVLVSLEKFFHTVFPKEAPKLFLV